ncbi:hypothetical protein LX69_00898 [Breznakibacter xylanolyticus]|uniref:Uncharacterized protein n=2 Tax=Breznakibacter xylanolyticus TaxID=990 RepID=A0A2W7NFR5_9BACT|nr:hypothetical protein LX69_00898 [Breznakibacter xylanolyticus]
MLMAVLALSLSFTACTEKDPFETITTEDEPRILDPIFANGQNGQLPLIAEINRDANLTMELVVTPSAYSTVTWLIDGYEVHKGTALNMNLKAGTYLFKVLVTTNAGKSTYREGNVKVNPLAGDPWATVKGFERFIMPGNKAVLYGDNLNVVKNIVMDGKTISDLTYIEDAKGNHIEYTVPADLSEGVHRVLLVDEGGNDYGANTVTVTRSVLVTEGANRANPNSEWRIAGLNMDQIASLTIAGETITNFTGQTATELVLTSPKLEAGTYTLTGKTSGNTDVQFYTAGSVKAELTVTISSETVLFDGHHYVSWVFADGNPNKTFNLIGKDVFATISAGSTLSIHYSIKPEDAGRELQTTSGSWTKLPGTDAVILNEDGVVDVVLTQEALDLIQAQDGFLYVGHGYYVDKVTLK